MCKSTFVHFPKPDGTLLLTLVSACIGTAASLAALVFVLVLRQRPIFVAGKPPLLCALSTGLLLANLGSLARAAGVAAPSQGTCAAFAVLFYIGFAITCASLAAKQWSAWLVYEAAKHRRATRPSHRELVAVVVAVALATAIVLAIWLGAFGIAPDPCNGFECTSNSPVVAYLAFCCLVFLALLTLAIALLGRRAPSVAHESFGVLCSSATLAAVLAILGPLIGLGTVSPSVGALLISLGIAGVSIAVLSLLVFRKLSRKSDSFADLRERYFRPRGSRGAANSSSMWVDAAEREQNKRWGRSVDEPHYPGHNHLARTGNTLPAEQVILPEAHLPASDGQRNFMEDRDIIATNLDSGQRVYSDGLRTRGEEPPGPQPAASPAEELDVGASTARARGFFVGHAGDYDAYVDRYTGEPFWLHRTSGTITLDQPGGVQQT